MQKSGKNGKQGTGGYTQQLSNAFVCDAEDKSVIAGEARQSR